MALKVALLQMDIAFGNPEANYKKVELLIENAMDESPDIIVLPELWTTGYDLERLDEIADPYGEKTTTLMSKLAKEHRVNIVAGSVAVSKEDKNFNTLLVFNRDGHRVKVYAKAHLFRLMREEKFLAQGVDNGLFSIDGIPAAGFICYDIRFPEWIRAHVLKGAGLLFIPAEWPMPRIDHWRNLALARAIENQCFVIACNRVGADPDNEFGGHSIVIDPWGRILAEADDQERILFAEFDPELLYEVRRRIPVFEDRRPELYQGLFDAKN